MDAAEFIAAKLRWQLALLCDTSLSTSARLLGAVLMHDFDDRFGGCAWRGQGQRGVGASSQRAEDSYRTRTGLNVRTIQLASAELETAGYLRIERGRGRGISNRYWPRLEKANQGPPFETEKANDTPPFVEEKANGAPPFLAEKANVGAVKGGPPFAQHLQDTLNQSAHAVRATPQTTSAAPAHVESGSSRRLPLIPRELFESVRRSTGDDPYKTCDTYLRWCLWDEAARTIHPSSHLARGRMESDIGRQLKEFDLVLGDPIGGQR